MNKIRNFQLNLKTFSHVEVGTINNVGCSLKCYGNRGYNGY